MHRWLRVGLAIIAVIVRNVVGWGLIIIAGVVLAVELIGLADPVSAKMSDDSDPFGNPYQPWWMHAIRFAIVAVTAWGGFRLAVLGWLARDRAT